MGTFKARRKQSKYKQILKSDLNIDVSVMPTKNLMLCNAGLVSGIQYELIAQLFSQYGKIENIIMIPKKSYCFVVFSSIDNAEEAYIAINGHFKLEDMDGPIYLLFTETVPADCIHDRTKSLPEGLTLLNDFVSLEEEEMLLNCVNWDTKHKETGSTLKHRKVKHFGYEFRYDINNVDKKSPLSECIPQECNFLAGRLKELGHPLPWTPNQLTVNQYQRGQGIPSHIDTHSAFNSPLLSLSLGSDVIMEFRRGTQHVPVLLPRRSLLIMDGETRYVWTHGITPRTMDVVEVAGGLTVQQRGCRTSFTFRRVREGLCQCSFPAQCDSQQPPLPAISDNQASQLEQLYVHEVYNTIASHFSETRTKVWPNVRDFLVTFSSGSLVIDAGCGNGKYFGINKNIFQVGFDRSFGLTDITRGRGNEVFVSDCLSLPLRDETADGLISVAVLHHLATRERRIKALNEMCRVLVRGGRALVTVWAKNQTKQDKTAYLKQDRKNRKPCDNDYRYEDTLNQVPICQKKNSKLFGDTDISENNLTPHISATNNEESSEHKARYLNVRLPIHTARTEFQHQDVFVPWKVKSKANSTNNTEKTTFLRYYHVFEENELLQLCSELTCIRILQTYYTEGNWCIVFEKNSS